MVAQAIVQLAMDSITPNSKDRPSCYRCNDWNWRGEEKHEASQYLVYCNKCWEKVRGYLMATT
jgi:hypothetical protein